MRRGGHEPSLQAREHGAEGLAWRGQLRGDGGEAAAAARRRAVRVRQPRRVHEGLERLRVQQRAQLIDLQRERLDRPHCAQGLR